jgi:hypothetical protein
VVSWTCVRTHGWSQPSHSHDSSVGGGISGTESVHSSQLRLVALSIPVVVWCGVVWYGVHSFVYGKSDTARSYQFRAHAKLRQLNEQRCT